MKRSLGWPIALGVVMIVLVVALIVGWVLLSTFPAESPAVYWTMLAIGTVFLVLVLVGVVLYLLLSIKEIRLNQRQANFVDSVSHELKSPIASLKLYLQTLGRRNVSDEEKVRFVRFMLEDVERLDTLINHMLDAARLDQAPIEADTVDVDLAEVLANCAETVCLRYHLPPETVRLNVVPAIIRARQIDLEMVFRNLIDNAVKYGGNEPLVEVDSHPNGNGGVLVRVSDNGPGISDKMHRKIFGRFVRLGSELERKKPGTGLGLFIVRTLVRRLKGSISVRGRGSQPGTVFEVQLPARLPAPSELSIAPQPAGESRRQS